MSRSFNKVLITGNVGREPETRSTQSKKLIVNFSLAVTDSWKDQNGQKVERVNWVNCVAFGSLAGVIEKYVHKGSALLIEGRLQIEQYEKDGQKRSSTKIVIDNMIMLGGGKRDENHGQNQSRESNYGRQNENLPGAYGQDAEFGEEFPLDFASLGDGETDVPF